MADEMELSYKQVTSNRPLAGDGNFTGGIIDFNWNIGGNMGVIPSKNYFRYAIQLKGPAATVPNLGNQLAFAENVAANSLTSVAWKTGGKDVSAGMTYLPQASACKNRLTKSGAWLNTMGKDSFYLEPDFQKRVNKTASGVPASFDENVQTVKLGTAGNQNTYGVAIATTGVVTGTNTQFTTAGIVVGDQIIVNGATYTVLVDLAGSETVMTVSPKPALAVDTGANGSALKLLREQDGSGRNIVYVVFQPPIGIFDHHEPMGSGDYRLELNPNANYKKACVQSKLAGLLAPADYDFEILEIRLFVATVKVNIPATGTQILHLMEHQVMSKAIPQAGENLLDFTVPSSTKAISVFVQSGDAGTNTQITPNMFKTKDGSDLELSSIQLSYANTNKPSTRWTSEFTNSKNFMLQRYTDTQLESGQFFSPGGCESFGDWLKRGPLYHYSFIRDKDDRSTYLQCAVHYTNLEANTNLFVVAHYSRTVQISVNNGFVTDVTSLSI
jgi:hypothetical protein